MRGEELAARRVLLGFQEIPTGVSIAATAGSVTVKENSGQGTFAVNGKTLELPVDGAAIKAKMKWARAGRNDDEDPGRAGRLRSPVGTNMTRVPIGP